MSQRSVPEGFLFCIGNPLLDISADVDNEFLSRYNLEADNAILEEKEPVTMIEDVISHHKPMYLAGGAGLNSIRYCQFLLNRVNHHATTYIGCIGTDAHGQKLVDLGESDGVSMNMCIDHENKTGNCGVYITGINRSLVAFLGAANFYQSSHIESNWHLVQKAQIFYNTGFFLTVSPKSIQAIAKHACEENKIYTTNLSAEFLINFFNEPMMAVIPYVDFLFGNEAEFVCFSEKHNLGSSDLTEIAKKVSLLPKENKKRERVVVVTCGCLPTLVVKGGEALFEVPVELLDKSEILDTNSAGDAFVGGFLSQLALGKDLKDCVDVGHRAARYCITHSGSSFQYSDLHSILPH